MPNVRKIWHFKPPKSSAFGIVVIILELHYSSIVKIKILFYSLSHVSHFLSHVSLSISQSLILSLLSVLTPSLQTQNSIATTPWPDPLLPTMASHHPLIISPLSRCKSVWWCGDRRLGFGAEIGGWVWCRDWHWAVGLSWVLFGFVMGCMEVGLIDINVGSECGDQR